MSIKLNLRDIGKRLRPEAILDIFKGGDTAKNMKRKLVHSMLAGGTGYASGNTLGGVSGGIWGYNEGKEALTSRNLGQNAMRGIVAGVASKAITNALKGGSGSSSTTSNSTLYTKLKNIPMPSDNNKQMVVDDTPTAYEIQKSWEKEQEEKKIAQLLKELNYRRI